MKKVLARELAWSLAGAALAVASGATVLRAATTGASVDNVANNAATANAMVINGMQPDTAANNAVVTTTPTSTVARSATASAPTVWTTYKGNLQRTGSSPVSVKLPLGLEWRYSSDADPSPITGSPLIFGTAQGRRVIFNAGRDVIALDAATGELIWNADATSSFRAPLALVGINKKPAVIATTSTGLVLALNAVDGTKIWEYEAPSSISVAPIAVRTAKGERIILALNNGTLIALTANGTLDPTWNVKLGTTSTAPSASPALNQKGDRLLVTGQDDYLYVVDVSKGAVLRALNLGSDSPMPPVALGDMVVTGSGSTALGIRIDNSSVQWRVPMGDENITSMSMSPGGIAYFATNRGSLAAIQARSGKLLWKQNVGRTSLSGTPLVLPNAILVGGRDSVLYAFNPGNGAIQWRYRVDTSRSVAVQQRVTTNRTSGAPGASATPVATNPYQFNPYAGQGNAVGNPGATSGGTVFAAATPTPVRQYELRTYGISSAPAIIGGQLFLPADNGALYSFATSFFDGTPPRLVETTIVVPTKEGAEFPVVMTDKLSAIPPKGPISLRLQLADEGSGINPDRIRAVFDTKALPKDDVKFNISTGVLEVTVQKYRKGEENVLSAGSHRLVVDMLDYSNNSAVFETTFDVNADFEQPSKPKTVSTATPTPTPAPPPPPWAGRWRDRWDGQGTPPWLNRGNGGGRRGRNNY